MSAIRDFIVQNQILLYACCFIGLILSLVYLMFQNYIENNGVANTSDKLVPEKVNIPEKPVSMPAGNMLTEKEAETETEQYVTDSVFGYKLEIVRTEKVFNYRIKNKLDAVICKSRNYVTRASCITGMLNLKNNIMSEVIDMTVESNLSHKKQFGKTYFYVMKEDDGYAFKLVNQVNNAQLESTLFSEKEECYKLLTELRDAEFFKLNVTIS